MSPNANGAPPYTITPRILSLVEQIGERIGEAEASGIARNLRLHRINRIRTIQGSLAIEGNTLSEEQIATLLDGRSVAGSPREIREARNAIEAYNVYKSWSPASQKDLLTAHGIFMAALPDAQGRYRRGGVMVGGGGKVYHVGPSATRVPELTADLLAWIESTDEHPLIAGSIFHYEFEFIHPFEDGNGRMGRLWQTLILTRWRPLFAHLAVESFVYAHQGEYYKAIRGSSEAGESTIFIEFMLEVILEALQAAQSSDQASDEAARPPAALQDGPKTAVELMAEMKFSHRHAFRTRYLRPAQDLGLVEMTLPESPTSKDQKYRLMERGRKCSYGDTEK